MERTLLRDMISDIIDDAYVSGRKQEDGQYPEAELDEILSVHMARFTQAFNL